MPIFEQVDELESERLLRMQNQINLMRLGEKFGVVTTHEQLDWEESERLLRMRPFKQEARSGEACSLTAAPEQSVHGGGVQNTIVSRNVEEAYEPGKDLDKKHS